jgi:hypothetical protein
LPIMPAAPVIRMRFMPCSKMSACSARFSVYYNGWRPHVSLGKDAPDGRPIDRVGDIVAHAILGGLHHRYARI